MRFSWKDSVSTIFFIALFAFTGTGNLWAASYGCFMSSTASADVPGNAGICATTPQGMLCSLDMTDCIIPSVGAGCPNLPNISFDAITNQCVVPPICQAGVYDTSYHQCVVTSAGTCPSGSTQATSGLCIAAPTCSAGTYNAAYNQCIVTSPGNCPTGATFDNAPGRCAGPLACQTGTYSSTSNMCVDPSGAIIGSPICFAGLTLNTTTNRCESVPTCPGTGSYNASMKLCVDLTPQTTCFTSSSVVLNSTTGMCEAFPDCASGSGQQFDQQAGVCIAHVPATCPPDGYMNTAKDRCEAPQGCTSGVTTSTGSLCLDTGPAVNAPICPAGTTMNATTNMCDAAPTCSIGTYDPNQHTCAKTSVTYAPAICPTGTTLNTSLDKCTATPTCTIGSYNPTLDACFSSVQPACSTISCTCTHLGTYCQYPPGCPSPTVALSFSSSDNLCEYQYSVYGVGVQCSATGCAGGSSLVRCTLQPQPRGYNYAISTCGTTPICSNNGTVNPATHMCEITIPATCPAGTALDGTLDLCTFVPTCSTGFYDVITHQCVIYTNTTAVPSCPSGTALNLVTNRCEASPTCQTNFTFDPTSHTCQSLVRTCPLGSQYPCQDYNGKKMCSAIGCVDLSSAPVTTVPDPPTDSQTNNGTIDPNSGQCMGQLVIFPGKPEYCRPPGLATLGTNCCSAAHGGKFSRSEDLDQAIKAAVDAYYQNIDTYINCDSNTVKIDEHPSGFKAGSDTINSYPVVAGTPVTYYQSIDPQSDIYPRFDYSTVTNNGMTTIQTVIDDKYGTWTTTGCGSTPTFSYATVYPREIVVTQTYGNYKNDAYVAINEVTSTLTPTCGTTVGAGGQYPDVAHDPYTDVTYVENPLVTMDSNTGVCTVAGNYADTRCKFACKTSMSGGNIQLTADYVLSSPPYSLVENVAVVAKGPTGTSVSLKMPSASDCEGFINNGQNIMFILGNETPALTASTTVSQQGAFSNQTILHTGFLPDLSTVQIFEQLFGVLSNMVNWYTSPCRPHEQQTDIDRDANKCHLVGSYCITKLWGNCTQRKTSYCCFNSKLGRIIQEQGRPQLQAFGIDGGWGTPDQPNCIGLSPEQFQMLDFSKMDLSEFIADIVQPIASDIAGQISGRIQNYYNNTQSQTTGTTH